MPCRFRQSVAIVLIVLRFPNSPSLAALKEAAPRLYRPLASLAFMKSCPIMSRAESLMVVCLGWAAIRRAGWSSW
jgi:hypothetical protein